jgi:hypothetical protein
LKVEKQNETPKIDIPETKGDSNIPVFELPRSKVDIRKSIPRSKMR